MENRSKINSLTCVAIGAFAIISSGSAFAQISKETMDVISIPDKVETAIGQLEFFDGVPNDATIDKLYDNRMYGPLEPWIDKTWRPREIEPVK